MSKTRNQKRKNQRLINKNKMVCMWCGEKGINLSKIEKEIFHCPKCNDKTRLIYKHHYNKLNEQYKKND